MNGYAETQNYQQDKYNKFPPVMPELKKEKGTRIVTEMCPHCEHEIEMAWDTIKQGFAAFCPVCGNQMMLCDECLHTCGGDCDWSNKTESCKHSINR